MLPTLFNLYFSDITKVIPSIVRKALFADDLGIWRTDSSLKAIETSLQCPINAIVSYCTTWGLILKKKKFYTVFCIAGLRVNYLRTYNRNIKLGDTRIPLKPHPTFLGITFDPKLNFMKHLENIELKLSKKVKLFRKIKSLIK